MRAITLFALILIGAPAFAQENANWPQFRGHRALGLAGGPEVPEKWDVATGENIRWKVPIAGLAHSSPVIWNERIFLTTADVPGVTQTLKVGLYGDIRPVDENNQVEFRVLCIDKASGKVLWNQVAHTGVPKFKRHTKATHANCTMAVDGKRVVAFFGTEGLYCYDLDGKLLWKKDLGSLDSGFFMASNAQWGFASSPVLYQDKIIVQCDVQKDSFITMLDATTGNEIWRTARDEVPTWSTPAVVELPGGPTQIVCNGWKQIAGYNLADGKIIWWMRGGGDIPVPTPIAGHDLVFITNAHGGGAPIYAIDLSVAKDDITLPLGKTTNAAIVWSVPRGGIYMQTPIIVGDLLFSCLDNGQLTCWQAKTGQKHYSQRVTDQRLGFTASPVASGQRLYFTAEDGTVHVVAATSKYQKLADSTLGEECMASPAVSDGVMYFRTRNSLIAVGVK